MTEQQQPARIEERRAWVGASDIAAILGVSPYANAADVYWAKVNALKGIDNAATVRGRFVEPAILDWFESQVGQPIARDVRVDCKTLPILVAQLDGQLPDGSPVEAKSAGSDDEWGEELTDEIPSQYIIQAHGQMICTETDVCHVPALVGGFKSLEFRRYRVNRDEALVKHILAGVESFWANHVEKRVPPADVIASVETMKRIRREPSKIVELDDSALSLIEALDIAKAHAKDANEAVELAQSSVLALLADAEGAKLPGGVELTYLLQNGARRCDLDLLRAHYPDAYAALVTQPQHRVLRVKRGGGKGKKK